MMNFEYKQSARVLFQVIRYAAIFIALWMMFSGCYQIFDEPVLGASVAALGAFVLVGAVKMKVFSFQIASLLYFLIASSVFITAWMPPPGSSLLMSRGFAIVIIILLLMLSLGSVSLARRLSLGHALRRKANESNETSDCGGTQGGS